VPDAPRPPESLLEKVRGRFPTTALGKTWLVTTVLAVLVVAWQASWVLTPVLDRPRLVGHHDWDQAEALRYLAVRSLKLYHQFPSWNPYACGGHPAWGGLDGDPNVVSPLLPVYWLLPLPVAMHVEIVVYLLVGAIGTWLLASRFTRSPGVRTLAVVVFAFDGRVGLQLAAGHLWHLAYALVPLSLFFLDRAIGAEPTLGPPRRSDVVWLGVCLAWMVYSGGAYAWPQTAVLLGGYALWLALVTRTLWPLGALGLSTVVAFGLSAPKLLPVLDVAVRVPRVTDAAVKMSPEALSAALLLPGQTFRTEVPGIPADQWFEVGLYVGAAAAAWLVVGALMAGGRREQPLRALAVAFVVLALGPFHESAPWSLARQLPVLATQAFPSRWLYLAVLLTACAAAGASERLLTRAGRARAALEVALLLFAAWVAVDIAKAARKPLEEELVVAPAATPERQTPFVTEIRLPASLRGTGDPAIPASLPAERANVGTIECNTFAGLSNYGGIAVTVPVYDGRPSGIGARGGEDPDYRGEAYLVEGHGRANVLGWSPEAVDVRVEGAQPGDHLVLNQNWDPGWAVRGADAWSFHNSIAATLRQGSGTVRFTYHARFAWLGLMLCAGTVSVLVALWRSRRRGPGAMLWS
jgi:hypothetical protein